MPKRKQTPVYHVQYWVFSEADLDTTLRAWAGDPTQHDDTSAAASRARFETVNRYLYSHQIRRKGMLKGFDTDTSEGSQ